jgi:transglutaminase-like putative cysteine protease
MSVLLSNKQLGWSFIVGSAVLGIGGLLLLRRKNGLGLGYQTLPSTDKNLVKKFFQPTPVVEEYANKNGKKMQHRRSASMSIEERVANIQEFVWKSLMDPETRKLALALTYNCPARDGKCEAEAIYKAVKSRIRYTGDIAPVKIFVDGKGGPVEPIDLYQTALRTWEMKGGDCDDHNILIASLLTLNGITARLRVTAESKGAEWGHIYVVAGLKSKINPTSWAALDTTLPNGKFGYEVPFAKHLDFAV